MQYKFESLRAEYLRLWTGMRVTKVTEAQKQARQIIANKDRYKIVEKATGVPWFVTGCLHMRESNGSFTRWLHNGDPMKRNGMPCRTVQVPKGRPPDPDVTWEQGAYDALVVIEHLDEIKDWGPEHVAYAAEKFNGFGYRHPARNIPSPYLWGGTDRQKIGKFVRDGQYDRNTWDPQLGAMAVLRVLMDLDPTAKFAKYDARKPEPKAPKPPPATPEQPSPKADDTQSQVKPVSKSKTIFGGIAGYLTTAGAAIAGFIDKLGENPYAWGFVGIVLVIGGICLYLVIKGRLDVQKIIEHLSQDDKGGE